MVFLSIDAMWLLHAWFFADMIVLFFIASIFLRLFLSDGRRVERHNLYASLAYFVVFLQRGFHHGILVSLFILFGLKSLFEASMMAL